MGLVELISSFRADRKIRKLIRGAPERLLDDVRENTFVRITGTVQPHCSRVIEAPLSGRPCAYYSLLIRARVASGGSLSRRARVAYTTVGEQEDGIPFELEVDGVRAVIDPTDAWISSSFDHTAHLKTSTRANDIWVRRGLVGMSPDARFEEAVLAIGERIAVFGAAMREPDPDGVAGEQGYRDSGPTRLRFSGSERFPLVIRDDLRSL